MRPPHRRSPASWWRFTDPAEAPQPTGAFRAEAAALPGRLYFPLANATGALSWTSPHLQGGLAASHHEYLTPPLTAEDLPHSLQHRGFWIAEPGREPFALSPIGSRERAGRVEAGPGWFTLSRRDPRGRFNINATLWCPSDLAGAVECFWVEVINTSQRTLAFLPYAAIPLFARSADNVRDHRHVTALLHRIQHTPHGVTVQPVMSFDERGHRANRTRYTILAFGPRGRSPTDVWSVEEEFLGDGGTYAAPKAVWERQRAPRINPAPGREAIGAFRFAPCRVAPGERAGFLLLSGISPKVNGTAAWTRWARRPAAWPASLARTQQAWQQRAHQVSFATGNRTLDQWLTWVRVQPHLRRFYGNSYLPQFDYGRGGRGWRDLWQDCLALLLSDPASVRPLLLHNFGGVRMDGSNATIIGREGEFIADRNNIPRTWMDHGCWPTFTTLLYVDQTGDTDFLFAAREYFRDPQIFRCRQRDPHWRESDGFRLRTKSGAAYRGTLLEHLLVQNLTAFFNVGGHNLCRLEGADWNDGLDMASRRGESVAFSAFYAWNLQRLAAVAERLASRGVRHVDVAAELGLLLDRAAGRARVAYGSASAKRARLDRYLAAVAGRVSGRMIRVRTDDLAQDLAAKHSDLALRIRRQEWIRAGGEGFFNGYYDDLGRRVEGARPAGVRMTLTGQVFALMAGIATDAQVDAVIRAVNRRLRDPRSGGVRLNTDFGEPQPQLGRAFSFAYGEKENGAVFSHMAVMYAYALYLRRKPQAGRAVWLALARMATDQAAAKIFPCLPEYFNAQGRGMYGYLTGSASWMVHLLLTQVYGIRGEAGDLVIDPQLTAEDFGGRQEMAAQCAFAGRRLEIRVAHPRRAGRGHVESIRVIVQGQKAPLEGKRRAGGGILIRRAALRP